MTIDIGITAQQKALPNEPIIIGGETTVNTEGIDNYKTHTFSSSEQLTVSRRGIVDILVVGGGGGGGADNGGGGGAGGVVYRRGYAQLVEGTYNVVIGAGGLGAPAAAGQTTGSPASNGGNTELILIPENYGDPIGSVVFDGSTGYLSIADNPALRLEDKDFTIESWVYLNNYNLYNVIAANSLTPANDGFFLATNSINTITRKSLTEFNTQTNRLSFGNDGSKMYVMQSNSVYEYDLSSAWDVNTAKHQPQFINTIEGTPNGTYITADGTKMYIVGNTSDAVHQFAVDPPFSIKHATFVQSFSVAAQDTNPRSVDFKPDGTVMYVIGITNDRLYEYSLSTAWDISTASFVRFISLIALDGSVYSSTFKPDGSKLYLSGTDNDSIYELTLTTPWDITTALGAYLLDVGTQDTVPCSVHFKPDGTRMYMAGNNSDRVNEYNLSIPWDVRTAVFSRFISIVTQVPTVTGLMFKPDGLTMFVMNYTTDTIFEYTLSEAWNISTAVYASRSFSVTANAATPTGLEISPDGTKLFITDTTSDSIIYYAMGTAWDITSATFQSTLNISARDLTPNGVKFSSDGTKMFTIGDTNDRIYSHTLSTPWDISTAVYDNFFIQLLNTGTRDFYVSPDGLNIYYPGVTTNIRIYQIPLTVAWDLTSAKPLSPRYVTNRHDTDPRSIRFKSDGTRMYMAGESSDTVYQYNLSTPWDITTAENPLPEFYLTDASNTGINFSNDGTKLYTVGTTGDAVYEYDLLEPWNIRRGVTLRRSKTTVLLTPGIAASNSNPEGLAFKPDGTKMYIVASGVDTIYEIDLIEPWNILYTSFTATNILNVTATETVPNGLFFKPDGTKMYMIGSSSDRVYEYDLSTPWQINTAVVLNSFSVTAQGVTPEGVSFKPDGTKMYIIELTTNSVYEYNLSVAWDITTAVVLRSVSLAAYGALGTDITFNDDGTRMYISLSTRLWQFTLTEAWNVTTATYEDTSRFNLTATETTLTTLDFNDVGTKMYVSGHTNDTIREYDLSVAWDITTAEYQIPIKTFADDMSDSKGIAFNDDGTKMFAADATSKSVYSYTLSTPWKVRTAVYDNVSLELPSIDNFIAIQFSSDGTKLYALDQFNVTVTEYDLENPWDITSATQLNEFSFVNQELYPTDFKFSADGTKLFIINLSRRINSYTLSTAWSLADVTYDLNFDVVSEANIPTGLGFSATGDRMYSLDFETTTVNQYDLSENWNIDSVENLGMLRWEIQAVPVFSTKRVRLKEWTHIAVSKVNGNINFFVNGELTNTVVDNYTYFPAGELRIGRGRGASTNYLNGAMSNFRLTVGSGLYRRNFTPSTVPLSNTALTALRTLTDNTTITDSSNNNFTITVNGTVSPSALTPFTQYATATPQLIAFGGGGGASGHTTVDARSGGQAGGSGGGGQGETFWNTYNYSTGGEALQPIPPGHYSNTFDLESRLTIANNSIFNFEKNTDYTVETWFYLEGDSPVVSSVRAACIISGISDAAGSTNSFEFVVWGDADTTGTGLSIGLRNNSATLVRYTYPATINKYTWYHAAFSKKDNVMSVYLNGVKIGEELNFTIRTGPGPNPIKIGAILHGTTTNGILIGKLSNLRVSKGIARYAGNEFNIPTSPFVDDVYTALLTCQSESFLDESKNQLSLTRVGSVRVNSSVTPFVKKRLFSAAFKNNSYLRVDFALKKFTTKAQPWTIECWINEASTGTNLYFMGINSMVAGDNVIVARRDGIVINDTSYTYSSSFTTGEWGHFAMTYDGTTLKVYKDGVEIFSVAIVFSHALSVCAFGLGTEFDAANGGTPGNYWAGLMHDLRVVDSVIYTDTFTPPTDLLEEITGTSLLALRSNILEDESSADCLITNISNIVLQNSSPYNTDRFLPVTETRKVLDSNYGSIEFNGSTDYIDVVSNFGIGTNDFTIEFWCNFTLETADTASRRIFSQGANAATAVQIYISDTERTVNGKAVARGTICFYTTADIISTVSRVNDGKWHHVAFTREGTTLRCFLDGVLVDSVTNSTNFSSTTNYRIGTSGASTTQGNYQGKLANIQVAVFKAFYTSNFTPRLSNYDIQADFVAFQIETKLLIDGQSIIDRSVNSVTLTLGGSVSVNEDSPFLQEQVLTPRNFNTAIKSYGTSGGEPMVGTAGGTHGGGGGGGAIQAGYNPSGLQGGDGGDGLFVTTFSASVGGGGGGGSSNFNGVNGLTVGGVGGLGGGGSGNGAVLLTPTITTSMLAAEGGTISTIEHEGQLYRTHVFTSSGILSVNTGLSVDILVVGGGGGGGETIAGGGGGGQFVSTSTTLLEKYTYGIVIGAGGAGGTDATTVHISGASGNPSSFSNVGAAGGGGGGGYNTAGTGIGGGAGGGRGAGNGAGVAPGVGQFAGGLSGNNLNSGAGGGGAGAVGSDSTSGFPGAGGSGLSSDITGVSLFYAGGGGGGARLPGGGTGAAGGAGGGGAGGTGGVSGGSGTSGTPNTGGGGGGGGYNNTGPVAGPGGSGGSGVVIVRYLIPVEAESIGFEIPSNFGQPNTGGGGGGSDGNISGGNGGSGVLKIRYKSTGILAVKNTDVITNPYNETLEIVPVEVSGPPVSYTYSIFPSLPDGLTFNTSTGEISGASDIVIDDNFLVTITTPDLPDISTSAEFRLVNSNPIRVVGGRELLYVENTTTYKVHKITETSSVALTGAGNIEYHIIGGGGAGAGSLAGTADGNGGGGAGGYVIGNIDIATFLETTGKIYADIDTQAEGWTTATDFEGTRFSAVFLKESTTASNHLTEGGARTIQLPPTNSYIEVKINHHSNVNVGVCRSSSTGGLDNLPSINLETGDVSYPDTSLLTYNTQLSRFRPGDILQILYDDTGNKVYFGKNQVWSKSYLRSLGDSIPGLGNLQIILISNVENGTSTADIEFLTYENYNFSAPEGYTALGQPVKVLPIVIGAGAAGSTTAFANGGDTVAFDKTALGGGAGGGFNLVGSNGGCGGGGGGRNSRAGGASVQSMLGSEGFGSSGGAAAPNTVAGTNAGGGGGGIPSIQFVESTPAAEGGSFQIIQLADGATALNNIGGAGGTGITLFDGAIYGSGGGGSGQVTGGLGGSTYAGDATYGGTADPAGSATPNSGSGGGGAFRSVNPGGSGGSGVVFIKYKL